MIQLQIDLKIEEQKLVILPKMGLNNTIEMIRELELS